MHMHKHNIVYIEADAMPEENEKHADETIYGM